MQHQASLSEHIFIKIDLHMIFYATYSCVPSKTSPLVSFKTIHYAKSSYRSQSDQIHWLIES
jgi:hypothetical protein